jgi:hypothetical protein
MEMPRSFIAAAFAAIVTVWLLIAFVSRYRPEARAAGPAGVMGCCRRPVGTLTVPVRTSFHRMSRFASDEA